MHCDFGEKKVDEELRVVRQGMTTSGKIMLRKSGFVWPRKKEREKRDAYVEVVSVSSTSPSVDLVVESCASVCNFLRKAMHAATKKRAHQHVVRPQLFFSHDR